MGRKRIRPKRNKLEEDNTKQNHVVLPEAGGCPAVEQDGVLSFMPYHGASDRVEAREQFVHSLCQVCKGEPPLETRVECGKCQLVMYCSAEHRRQHWPAHAELCDAVQAACVDQGFRHILQPALNTPADQYRLLRFQAMVECETRIERPLDKWEREMFIFPNLCGRCHQWDKKVLIPCGRCRHTSFCQGHQIDAHHKWCSQILRYKDIVREQHNKGLVCPTIPVTKLSTIFNELISMKKAFESIVNNVNELELLELTEITTYPLTALEAMRNARNGELLTIKTITVHIIGAEADFETNRLEKWEYYFLHLIPALKNLEIVFVGPELNPSFVLEKSKSFKICSRCVTADKRISFKFHNTLYHDLVLKGGLSKADLVCVFNPGLYRVTGFNGEDTWGETISSMFRQGCPVLSTAYTEREAVLDVKRVSNTLPITLDIPPTLNHFASIKPALNFVSEEDSPVIFKNQFYCIMQATVNN